MTCSITASVTFATSAMQEHKALGMVGKVELPAGFDKLEGEIKWNSFYRDAMLSAANPYKSLALQLSGSD